MQAKYRLASPMKQKCGHGQLRVLSIRGRGSMARQRLQRNGRSEIGKITALLRDSDRYIVESIWSRPAGEQVVAAGDSGLPHIAGPPDGVKLVRIQRNFPAALELIEPFAIGLPSVWGTHAAKYPPL